MKKECIFCFKVIQIFDLVAPNKQLAQKHWCPQELPLLLD